MSWIARPIPGWTDGAVHDSHHIGPTARSTIAIMIALTWALSWVFETPPGGSNLLFHPGGSHLYFVAIQVVLVLLGAMSVRWNGYRISLALAHRQS